MAALHAYSWPGNLRELQSVLKQALLRATGSVLLPSMLPNLRDETGPRSAEAAATQLPAAASTSSPIDDFIRRRLGEGSEGLYDEAHRELDRVLLPLVMEHTRGNQFQAAKVLGVARQTLRRRLRELHIAPRFTDGTDDDTE